jgi:hypothetical protein
LKAFDAEASTGMTRHDVLHTQNMGGVLADHRRALASHIAYRPFGLGRDRPFGQDRQASQVGQPTRIGMVIGILQATVRLYRGRVGAMDPRVRLHQPSDSPVPVVGRLDDYTLHLRVLRSSLLQDRGRALGNRFR